MKSKLNYYIFGLTVLLIVLGMSTSVKGQYDFKKAPVSLGEIYQYYIDNTPIMGIPKLNDDGKFLGINDQLQELESDSYSKRTCIPCEKGSTVRYELWKDLDSNLSLSEDDILIDAKFYTDGEFKIVSGYLTGDMDSSANGKITLNYTDITVDPDILATRGYDGSFLIIVRYPDNSSFYNGDYMEMAFTRDKDYDERCIDKMKENGKKYVTITGEIVIEGEDTPLDYFEFLKVGQYPVWSFPEKDGEFKVEFLGSYAKDYQFPLGVSDWGSGLLLPPEKILSLPEDGTDRIDAGKFIIPKPTAFIKGKIVDQYGDLIGPVSLSLCAINDKDGESVRAQSVFNRQYMFRVIPGKYSLSVGEITDGDATYYYMYPIDKITFELTNNDTLTHDIMFYKPLSDQFIFVQLDRPESLQNKAFPVRVRFASYLVKVLSNVKTGMAMIPVSNEILTDFRIEAEPLDVEPGIPVHYFDDLPVTASVGDTVIIEVKTDQEKESEQ